MGTEVLLEDGGGVDDAEDGEEGTEGANGYGPGTRAALGELVVVVAIGRACLIGSCVAVRFESLLNLFVER